MARALAVMAVVALAITSCSKKYPVDKVTYVPDGDPRMNAAMEKARSTVNIFIAALKSPKAGQSAFSIKMGFTDAGTTEHMWLTPAPSTGPSSPAR
jgi:uncharacterized protein YegJ (DUF2314 family)